MSVKYHLKWGKQHELLTKYDRWKRQAKLLGLSKKAQNKLAWFIYYYSKAGKQASTTTRYFGITRKTFYKWFAVFDPINLKALEENSRAPVVRRVSEVTPLEEARILRSRKANP